MKIAKFSAYDTLGGASVAAVRLTKALLKSGLNAQLFVQTKNSDFREVQPLYTSWLSKKMAFLRFVCDRLSFLFYEKSRAVRFAFSTAKIGTDISQLPVVANSDIIHLHWINFGFLSLKSIENLLKLNKPVVFTLHDMWLFTGGCHFAGNCQNFTYSCGNCDQFLRNPSTADLSYEVWHKKKAIFETYDFTVVTCSQWLAEQASKSSLLAGKKIVSIPNPIDTELFKPMEKAEARQIFGLDPQKKYILFAAANIADARKGFSYFIDALHILQTQFLNKAASDTVEIILFGKSQIDSSEALPFMVNHLGQISDIDRLVAAYSAASVFVIPSLEDNLPNTIMEAMACGTPCVGFATGGIPEMIVHEKTGYLAQYKDAHDLAKGMKHVLFDADATDLAMHARQKVVEEYAEAVVAEKYRQLYQSLIKAD